MGAWKYVIMKIGNTEVPVIFPDRMVHALVADAVKDYFMKETAAVTGGLLSRKSLRKIRDEVTPVSAGSLTMIVTHAGGHSETLELTSRPEDKDAINRHPYTGGML